MAHLQQQQHMTPQKIMPQQQHAAQLPVMQPQPLSIAISTSSFSSITDANIDTYDIEKRKITEEQSERLVQKILKRTKK